MMMGQISLNENRQMSNNVVDLLYLLDLLFNDSNYIFLFNNYLAKASGKIYETYLLSRVVFVNAGGAKLTVNFYTCLLLYCRFNFSLEKFF